MSFAALGFALPGHLTAQAGPGIITTIAGGGAAGDDSLALHTSLFAPADVAVDGKGNIYIADSFSSAVRRVGPDGVITTLALVGWRGFPREKYPVRAAVVAPLGPFGVAVDDRGNVYVADTEANRIRRIGPDGVISIFAGVGWTDSGPVLRNDEGQPAVQAHLYDPNDVDVDGKGNVYIVDGGNHRICRVGPDGTLRTVAGRGSGGFSGDGGPAIQAQLNSPGGVAVDGQGNVYIADTGNNRVRRVGPDGIITTVAGTRLGYGGGGFSGDGGPAVEARLNRPTGVAVDGHGNLYIVDTSNHRIRRVGPDGIITTFAGTGTEGFSGDGGTPVQAQLNYPGGVAVDGKGNVYIADTGNNRIRRVEAEAVSLSHSLNFEKARVGSSFQRTLKISNLNDKPLVITGISVEGADASQFSVSPTTATVAPGDRQAISVTFAPSSLGEKTAFLSVARGTGSPLRVTLSGTGTGPEMIATIAGVGTPDFFGDGGPAVRAALNLPYSVAVDGQGKVYITDTGIHLIRLVGVEGRMRTLTNVVPVNTPSGVAVDVFYGNIYVADTSNHRIRSFRNDWSAITVAGTGVEGFSGDGGFAHWAQLSYPSGVAADNDRNLYIADTGNHRVRRVNGVIITTIAGTGVEGFSEDGGPAISARLSSPRGVAVDHSGNVYIADTGNHRVRRVGTDGMITTIAGTGTAGFSGDGGLAVQARLNEPTGVATDVRGNVYIADRLNHRVRRVGTDGMITTIAGTGTAGFSGDGGLADQARLNSPRGVAVDEKGDVYIADTANHRIRRVMGELGSPSADFDGNGEVDFSDFFALAGAFGGTDARFDLDRDGVMGFGDFFAFAAEFGKGT